jgi:hypothetical protein
MFVGVLLVAFALIGGILLLLVGGDDDSDNGQSERVTQLQDELLQRTVVNPDLGMSVRRPNGWAQTKDHGVITVTSPDNCVVISLSAPAEASGAGQLRDDSVALLRRTYKNATVQSAPDSEVGGIPTTADTILLKDEKGNQIRILLSVGKGEKNAYLTQVVVRDLACQGALQRAQLIVSSIEYTK